MTPLSPLPSAMAATALEEATALKARAFALHQNGVASPVERAQAAADALAAQAPTPSRSRSSSPTSARRAALLGLPRHRRIGTHRDPSPFAAMTATLAHLPSLPDPLGERADSLADRAAVIATHRDPVAVAQCLADASALQRSAITTAAQALRHFVAAVRAERAVIDAATRLQPTTTTSPTPFVREGVIPVALVRTWLTCAADEGHLPRSAAL